MGNDNKTGLEIAVIGMSGRFPGAKDIEQFWNNQKNGIESISFFTEEELIEAGADSHQVNNPNYVKAYGALEDVEYFDSAFFEYTPNEAAIMDPQIRFFHECAWQALEDAGYCPYSYEGLIGLYAGASPNFQWEAMSFLSGKSNDIGSYTAVQLSDKDFLCLRISYKLNLTGPAIQLNTACSTSLVAIHLACQGLLNGECDIALAGGVSVTRLRKEDGYMYQEGMIMSPDGHCRAFDAKAKGTVGGEGAAMVVLKRFEEAAADRDTIHAVIKGSAINNDGIQRVGFTAPSVEGQAKVIKTALHMAEVEPETIAYIETHGTGTVLGDPVEIEGLTLAFNTDKKDFCRIGSTKANVGHLDAAAGVTGFIKAVLALKYKLIPPSLHFETPNPKIDFANSPFYVNNRLTEWKADTYPLRVGVSSFGIGGTNAHVILEEAPGSEKHYDYTTTDAREYQLIVLSAKTGTALEKMSQNLVEYLKKNLANPANPVNPGLTLADAAYTLQVGRARFQYRRMLVCREVNEAVDLLSGKWELIPSYVSAKEDEIKPVIFMFPGQGSQYVNMGLELYQKEPVFKEEMDRCFEILNPLMDADIKDILYPSQHIPHSKINQTEIAQPLIFIIEYALAKLLIKWGISPAAMIGHSIGEYIAACLSGVFSLEDALELVVLRGRLMQQMPTGAMLSVPLAEDRLKPLLRLNDGVELAAVNGPALCVVTGSHEAVDAFEKQLRQEGCEGNRLHTSHAFHSRMMEPILKEFEEKAKQITCKPPQIPYISNLTGEWITAADVFDPHYWARHLRETVRFSGGLQELLSQQEESCIFVEVGPGRVLSNLVKKHLIADNRQNHETINIVRHPKETVTDEAYLLDKIGRLWLYGININWPELYTGQKRYRIPLPTYSFDPLTFPVDPDVFKRDREFSMPSIQSLRKNKDLADWFYTPSWERSQLTAYNFGPLSPGIRWLLFIKNDTKGTGFGSKLSEKLEQMGQEIIEVNMGPAFTKVSDREFIIDPQQKEDYEKLFGHLQTLERIPVKIIHLWAAAGDEDGAAVGENLNRTLDTGLFSLLNIVHAIVTRNITAPIQLGVVTTNMQEVVGGDLEYPEKSTILGAVKVIPLEYDNIDCRSIDIELPPSGSRQEDRLIRQLLEEFTLEPGDKVRVTAYRGDHRWVQLVKPIRLDKSGEVVNRFRKEGVYLITGGFGGMGFRLAQHLGEHLKARLILVGRSFFPGRSDWQSWLENQNSENPISRKIREIKALEAHGAEVMTASADVSDKTRMKEVIVQAQERFGRVNGILHTAGIADYAGVIHKRTRKMTEEVMAAKVKGTLVICDLTGDMDLDFFVLFSSLGNYIKGFNFGQVGYSAANEFLDAFAYYNNAKKETFTVTISWDGWREVGMAVEALRRGHETRGGGDDESVLSENLTPSEGVEAFNRILENKLPHIIISTRDLIMLNDRINAVNVSSRPVNENPQASEIKYSRPQLKTTYAEPESDVEKILCTIWENYLGIDRVGIHDNFFDLGANSMDITQINIKIKQTLQREISVINLYTYPTVHSLSQSLTGEENEENTKNDIEALKKERKKGKSKLQKRKSRTSDSTRA